MFRNYLIIAFRNLKNNKTFSLVNIVGLAIGMSASLLILHYVSFERSYDRYHDNADRIYRLRYERTDGSGASVRFASCSPPAAARIRGNYAEVEKIGRMLKSEASASYQDKVFKEERMFYAEPDILSILKIDFVTGDPSNAISQPNQAIFSRSTAARYFGDEEPIGKIISIDKKNDYQIVGIFEDTPENTHLKIDILLPWENLAKMAGPEYTEAWGHTGSYTYLITAPGTDPLAFEKKLAKLVETEIPELKDYNITIDLKMQPLAEIHLTSHFMQEYEANGNRDSVDTLFIIAIFIMIMAWINFINLSTARSINRAKEVGLRKVVGASRRQLMVQFFYEIVLTNILSTALAIGLITVALPFFTELTGVPMAYSLWTQNWLWYTVAAMFGVGVFLSGLYPVMVMSSFEPATVLKGKLSSSPRGIVLRKALVVFQFTVGLVLIIATFIVFEQLSFMRNQKLGFSMEQTLVVKAPRVRDDTYGTKFDAFKQSLLARVDIKKISHVTEVPGRQIYWDNGGIHRAGQDAKQGKNYQIVGVDYEFADLFELEFVAGRNFSPDFPSDAGSLILNETAMRFMGFESPDSAIGQQVDYWGQIFPIIGVLKDYHQQSLKEAFEPHLFRFIPYGRGPMGMIAMKVNVEDVQETISAVKKKYNEFFPGNSFDYFFLDDYYNQQYQSDELFGKVYGLFSMLAIFVIALGIYGLSAFSVTQRTKEIGIRKVLGASVSRILGMLTREFALLVLIANVIAWPVAYYAMKGWLDAFAFRTSIGLVTFVLAGLSILLIAGLTVSYQVISAALANPVDAIKYE